MRYRPLKVVLLGWWESRRRSSRPTRPSRRCKATKKAWTCWQPGVLFANLYGYLLLVTFSQELCGNLVYSYTDDTWVESLLRLRNLYLQQGILFTGVPSCCRLLSKSKCHGQARTAAHYQGERMKKAKEAVPWRSQWSFAARILNSEETKMWFLPVVSRWTWHRNHLNSANSLGIFGKWVSTSPSEKINHETIPKHTGSATEAAKET